MRPLLCTSLVSLLPLMAGAEIYIPRIWPTARIAGVVGAVTALSDGIETALWNPAGFGALCGIGASGTLCDWTPALANEIKYQFAAAGIGVPNLLPGNRSLGFGLSYAYFDQGMLTNSWGVQYHAWERLAGVHCGVSVLPRLRVGLAAKLISAHAEGLTRSTLAADLGCTYKAFRFLDAGFELANLGKSLAFLEGYVRSMPTEIRFALAVTPLDNSLFRVRLLPEFDYTLARPMAGRIKDVSSLRLGAEATLIQYFSARYGRVIETDYDGLLRQKTGLSIGIGYMDYVRLEFSSEWLNASGAESATGKFSLALNDVVGLVRELGKGI